jgi:hypothetical protein
MLLLLFAILLNILLSGCITPPDIPACFELSISEAYCTYTVSDKDFYWNETTKYKNKTYFEQRPANIILPQQSWAELKAFIIKNCKKNKSCSKDMDKWSRKIESLERK